MSYQVLARKWRPRTFAEMVGQEHVLRALINALDNNRLHHAFLFTGTRGVGKTTIARILAKSLNCETGVTSKPCGQCGACLEIDAGRFVDLIEVDAASRTGVDDTRELLENVQYAPTRGRYKVYLVDEVHMLSKSAFNALLKTLEEPPPHVKFLLATTDPQKIPVTVLSRCLQFNLKRLPVKLIQERLTHILQAEHIAFDDTAIVSLSHAADGSLRDALSLLDQAIAFGAGTVRSDDVQAMLGSIEKTHVRDLLNAVAAADGGAVLAAIARLDEHAPDYQMALDDLASTLQRVAVIQAVPDAGAEFDESDGLTALAGVLDPGDVQLYYQIALLGKRDLGLAPSPRAGFEMTLLRMLAFQPDAVAPQRRGIHKPVKTITNPPGDETSGRTAADSAEVKASHPQAWHEPDWPQLVEALPLRGAAQQLAAHCAYRKREGNTLFLEIGEAHRNMATSQLIGRLEEGLTQYFGEALKLRIQASEASIETPAALDRQREDERVDHARAAIAADPNIRELCDAFGTQVNPELVKPSNEP